MAGSRPRKKTPRRTSRDPGRDLAAALAGRSKEDLVRTLADLAHQDPKAERRITSLLGLELPGEGLVAQTRQAIADATDFDERERNRNFDYDLEAYATVRRNLGALAASGRLHEAMVLAVELMRAGSYQVESSDEGLMAEDIEACLDEVIQAVRSSDLPARIVAAWSRRMLKADCVLHLRRDVLEALAKQDGGAAGAV